jgi:pyruvate ferredoxin oxidoreductase beta subunit
MAAHHIPYVAQTTYIGNFKDIHQKAEAAIYTQGPAFLNVLAPCPRGWRYEESEIMDICKAAVETCVWPLFEVIEGEWVLNYEPKTKLPVEEYLKTQGRFKHLFKPGNEHLIAQYQTAVDERWEELKQLCGV